MGNDVFIETMNVDVFWKDHPQPMALVNQASQDIRTVVLEAIGEELSRLELTVPVDLDCLDIELKASKENWKEELQKQVVEIIQKQVKRTATISDSNEMPMEEEWIVRSRQFFTQGILPSVGNFNSWKKVEEFWKDLPISFYQWFSKEFTEKWIQRLARNASKPFLKLLFEANDFHQEWVRYFLEQNEPVILEESLMVFFSENYKEEEVIAEQLWNLSEVRKQLDSVEQITRLRTVLPSVADQFDTIRNQENEAQITRRWAEAIQSIQSPEVKAFLSTLTGLIDRLPMLSVTMIHFLEAHHEVEQYSWLSTFSKAVRRERKLNRILRELKALGANQTAEISELIEVLAQERLNEQSELVQAEHDQLMEDESLIVSNAGIVLLNPFLPMLFRSLSLQNDESKWISTEHHLAAIYLLNYLSTGTLEADEDELYIGRILTAFDQEEIIPQISEEQFSKLVPKATLETELEQLIQAVRDNWRPMRNCSWNGLRNDFLSRTGTIKKAGENDYELTIESGGLDVMLSYKDWSISMITYSWLEGIIYVKWGESSMKV